MERPEYMGTFDKIIRAPAIVLEQLPYIQRYTTIRHPYKSERNTQITTPEACLKRNMNMLTLNPLHSFYHSWDNIIFLLITSFIYSLYCGIKIINNVIC